MKIVNSYKNEAVIPKNVDRSEINEGILTTSLSKTSWNVIRLGNKL